MTKFTKKYDSGRTYSWLCREASQKEAEQKYHRTAETVYILKNNNVILGEFKTLTEAKKARSGKGETIVCMERSKKDKSNIFIEDVEVFDWEE